MPNRHDSEVIYKRWRDRMRPHTARYVVRNGPGWFALKPSALQR